MAKDLDGQVAGFRSRPLDAGPYTFVAANKRDALTMKVRECGRVVKIAVMVATGTNDDGYREILGIHTATTESGAGWLAYFLDLVARGLGGVGVLTLACGPTAWRPRTTAHRQSISGRSPAR